MVRKKMSASEVIELLRAEKDFLRSLNIKSIYLFGSYARNEQTSKSDIDLIVEFDVVPSLFEFVRVQRKLSDLLGIKVDLVMKDSLKPRVAQRAQREALEIHCYIWMIFLIPLKKLNPLSREYLKISFQPMTKRFLQ
jgi:uncharacterized protein